MTNQTQATDPNDQNVVEFSDSPGRRLRVQRQSRGLTIERIASQLHLKPEIIEALEQDRFELLPDPVFITGYLRNYARALGVDPAPLIAAYQTHAGAPKSIAPTRPVPGSGLDSGGTRLLVRLVSLALVIAVLAMIALWWHDRPEMSPELDAETTELEPDSVALDPDPRSVDEGGADAAGAAEENPEAETGSADPADPADGDRIAMSESPESPMTGLPEPGPELDPAAPPSPTPYTASEPASEGVTETAPSAAAEVRTGPIQASPEAPTDPDDAVPVPTSTATKGIVLEFTGPSWLEVRDAAGQRLIVGEMKAGDRREVTGQAPFRFTVGRVSNSSMTVDGKSFDLEGRSRGNVARFSFDPESPE